MTIHDNVTDLIGGTPLVRLPRIGADLPGEIIAKLESANPGNSVKDRIGRAIVDAAEAAGELRPGGTIVEGTSGNTGIALAMVGAARGYRVVLTMPDTMSMERRVVLRAFGAELVLTPGAEGMKGAVEKAREIVAGEDNAILASQFANPANPAVHEAGTGPEIWEGTGGAVDYLVAGIGTGGTITGAGRHLKGRNPDLRVIGVEPAASPLLTEGTAGPHKIQGLGANFIPEVLDRAVLDEVLDVSNEDAIAAARRLAAEEGILAGISAGAAVAAAARVAAREEAAGKRIVVIIPDFGERYISTVLFDDLRG
ncbi:cysteine synthase [Corynebacterium sphenisci DSM 44792]|uniref:Cysteine synthase n=1 Tax=Corynebacterium sphenisci DSM 44792 TaxID=1437874 RepID=A0A1L7CZQ4_9CORY|nr:cysteine synthase A [Corynebacterium sphenisci]APT91273.1 cysteine synthase [Corynebacterium sphenisci DSM 44792]